MKIYKTTKRVSKTEAAQRRASKYFVAPVKEMTNIGMRLDGVLYTPWKINNMSIDSEKRMLLIRYGKYMTNQPGNGMDTEFGFMTLA